MKIFRTTLYSLVLTLLISSKSYSQESFVITSELLEIIPNEHLSFLDTLNEVSNAFKHSFINTDMSLVGSEGWIQVPIATFPKRRDIARRCVKLRLSRPSTKQALRCPIPILAHASAASFSRSRSSD